MNTPRGRWNPSLLALPRFHHKRYSGVAGGYTTLVRNDSRGIWFTAAYTRYQYSTDAGDPCREGFVLLLKDSWNNHELGYFALRTSWEVGGGGLKFLYPSAASHFAQPWLVKVSTSPSAPPPGLAFFEGTVLHCTTGQCRRGGVCRGGQRAAQWRLPAGWNRSARFPSHFQWGGVRRLTKNRT